MLSTFFPGKSGRDRLHVKIWLDPIQVESISRCSRFELGRIQEVVKRRQAEFLEEWHVYFSRR